MIARIIVRALPLIILLGLSAPAQEAAEKAAPPAAAPTKAPAKKKSIEDTIVSLDMVYGESDIIYNEKTGQIMKAEFDENVRARLGDAGLECHHMELLEATAERGQMLIATATATTPVLLLQESVMGICGRFERDLDNELSTLTGDPIVYQVRENGSVVKNFGEKISIEQVGEQFRVRSSGGGLKGVDPEAEALSPYLKKRLLQHVRDSVARAAEQAKAKEAAEKAAAEKAASDKAAPKKATPKPEASAPKPADSQPQATSPAPDAPDRAVDAPAPRPAAKAATPAPRRSVEVEE